MIVYSLNLSLVEPLDTLAVLPETELYFVVFGHNVRPQTVLLTLVPKAFVAALVGPSINSEAMFFIVLVLSAVHPSVVLNVNAHTFHIVIKPLSLVLAAVQPRINTDPRNFILSPIACVH